MFSARTLRAAVIVGVAAGLLPAGVALSQLGDYSGDDSWRERDVPSEWLGTGPLPPPETAPQPPDHPESWLPPLPATPTMLSHGGPAVRGARVAFSLVGLDGYAGEEVHLTLHAAGAVSEVYPASVEADGTALVGVHLPRLLSGGVPVVHGPLGVLVTSPAAPGTVLVVTEITVTPATSPHLYPVELRTGCRPARVELDDDVWVPASAADVAHLAAPSVPGVFWFNAHTARYTPASDGRPVTMVRADPGMTPGLC